MLDATIHGISYTLFLRLACCVFTTPVSVSVLFFKMRQIIMFVLVSFAAIHLTFSTTWCRLCVCVPWLKLMDCSSLANNSFPNNIVPGFAHLSLDNSRLKMLNISHLLLSLPDLSSISLLNNPDVCIVGSSDQVIVTPGNIPPCTESRTLAVTTLPLVTSTASCVSSLHRLIATSSSSSAVQQTSYTMVSLSLPVSKSKLSSSISPTTTMPSSHQTTTKTIVATPHPSVRNNKMEENPRGLETLLGFAMFWFSFYLIWIIVKSGKAIRKKYRQAHRRDLTYGLAIEMENFVTGGADLTWNDDDASDDDDIVIYELLPSYTI